MSQTLTVELPDELARRARNVAAAGNRRLEDAVVDWISQAVAGPDLAALSDDELLSQCDSMIAVDLQDELSRLLADAREGNLPESARGRLDELMANYRRGLVQKARAWKVAVARGLRASVNDAEAIGDHAT
jgi:hypothetical protein